MYCDFHTHTSFSSDSDTSPRAQIEKAISLRMERICITDHEDIDFPPGDLPFVFDGEEYFHTLRSLQHEYASRIRILIGVELGLQPHLQQELAEYTASYPFDYIIGSTHLVQGIDPYDSVYFHERGEYRGILEYFEAVYANLQVFHQFDVLGHLDYVVRYAPSRGANYDWHQYGDILDAILHFIIDKGIGLECNTAGLAKGIGHPNPHKGIIKRYLELGGEIITLGSDGHKPEFLGYAFEHAGKLLKQLGADYYAVFENRQIEFLPL